MKKTIEIPEGYEARIGGNKVILEPKESEDERIRKHIIKILDNLAPCHWDGNEKARCIAYLERQKEQKPAEWSEEDREMRMKILKYLSTRCSVIEYEEVENWLNNLRPQPHWKPSKEQMKEYSYWYKNFIESGLASPSSKAVNVLRELLEQLKKL